MMGWFERQKNKKEADKEAGARLPENSPRRAEGEMGDLEQSEPKFRFLFDNMRSGVAIYQVLNNGEDFIIADFNGAAEKLENVRREDIIGKNVVEVFPGIKEMGLLEVLRRVWRTGKAEFSRATLYRDPVRTGWRENYVCKLPSGEIVAIYDDVTERKRAELALRMGEQRFRAIADYTYHWESWVGPTGTLFWVNPAVERITGYTVEECMKMADYPMPLIHESDRQTMNDILREARKGGVGKDVEFRIRRKDGKVIWVEIAWQGIYDNKGVYQGYRASIDDITERALAEEALKTSEGRYRALVENVELGIMMVGVDHTIITVNSGMGKLFGKSASEIIGKKCDELFVGEGAKIFGSCPGDIALQKCERVVVEKEGIRADGSRFPARVHAFPVYPGGELSAYFIKVVEDITEDKLAQEKLLESEQRYRSFVQNFTGIAFRAKPDLTPIFIHGIVKEVTGYGEEELLSGKVRWEQIVHPDDVRTAYDKDTKRVQTSPGFLSDKEYRIIRKDGEVRWVRVIMRNLAGKDGKVAFIQGAIYDITDRKHAQEELLKGEKKYRELVETMSEGLGVTDKDYIFTYVNRRFAEMLGYRQDEMTGHHLTDFLDEQNRRIMHVQMAERRAGKAGAFDLTWTAKDGHKVYTIASPKGIFDEKGNFAGSFGVLTDITERKKAEEELRASKEQFRALTETTSDWVWEVNQYGVYTYASPKVRDLLGYEPEEVIGRTPFDFMPAEEAQRIGAIFQASMKSQKPFAAIENVNLRKDGRRVVLETSAVPFFDADGKFAGYRGIDRDVTERREAEKSLREKEQTIRAIVETSQEWIWAVDLEGFHTYSNPAIERILGYKPEELIGRRSFDLMHEEDRKQITEEFPQWIKQKSGWTGRIIRWRHKDGSYRYLESNAVAILDSQGNLTGFRGVDRDITERKRAEEKLRSEEKKYHEIVDSLAEGLGISDENYVWTYVNKRFAEMLRYGQDEMIGRKVTDFMDEQNRKTMAEQIAKRKRGVSEPYDVGWVTKDGHKVYTMVSPKGIYDEEGNFRASFGVLVDITERKKAEDERESLLKAIEQKNKELESILYVASHDLKSALLGIESLGNDLKESCELVKLVLADRLEQLDEKSRNALDRDIPETVKSILSSAGKMEVLLGGLLRLSHAGSAVLKVERLDMNRILAKVVENFKQRAAEKKVSVDIEELPGCIGDVSLIKEVFSNLLDNALKYLDDSRRGVVRVWGKVEDGQSIYCVEDNGIGIAREYYEKIFDMFYQLEHGKKRGEGLGLTIVRRIVERHKGRVWVASEVGKGSRFYVSLPGE
jgi:PAS domain S-box-containing protein